jgi:predicted P-loop ATPase
VSAVPTSPVLLFDGPDLDAETLAKFERINWATVEQLQKKMQALRDAPNRPNPDAEFEHAHDEFSDGCRAYQDLYGRPWSSLRRRTAPTMTAPTVPTVPTTPAPPAAVASPSSSTSLQVRTASNIPEYMPAASMPRELAGIRYAKNGDVIPDEENVRIILTQLPHLQGIVRYDEFSGELILARPITAEPDLVGERGIPRPWTDEDTITLQTFIQRYIVPRMGRERIEAVVSMHGKHNCAFHPVRDYLQSLEWDGKPRLDTWLTVYFGANKQPADYLAKVGAAWLISGVARIFEPGCKADHALVLEGAQGIFKSTALRTLAGNQYFSDSLSADLSHKDARDHLRGKWIIELAELSQFKRSEIETVKAFISRMVEQYRPSYGRHEISFPRQCIFAGSTNDETYLVDRTGNRRWWAVSCGHVDLDALKRDRDQLWAEAVHRYRKNEKWWLSREMESLADAEAALRVAHDPWTAGVADITAEHLKGPDVSPGEVMARMNLPTTERHDRSAGRVGQILRDLGWARGKRDRTRGQLYVRPGVTPPPPVYQYRPGTAPTPSVIPPPAAAIPPPPSRETTELVTALDALGRPAAVTVLDVLNANPFMGWLVKPQYARDVLAGFAAAGYTPVEGQQGAYSHTA